MNAFRPFEARRAMALVLVIIALTSMSMAVTTEDGSGLALGGDKGDPQALSRGTDHVIKIVTKDGRNVR